MCAGVLGLAQEAGARQSAFATRGSDGPAGAAQRGYQRRRAARSRVQRLRGNSLDKSAGVPRLHFTVIGSGGSGGATLRCSILSILAPMSVPSVAVFTPMLPGASRKPKINIGTVPPT